MRLSAVSPEAIRKIVTYRCDCYSGRHEGPESWEDILCSSKPQLTTIHDHQVLLPMSPEQFLRFRLLSCFVGDDGQVLTLFLDPVAGAPSPEEESFRTGYVCICYKVPEEDFFITVLFHRYYLPCRWDSAREKATHVGSF